MISNKLIGLAALAFLCGSAGFTAVGCSSTETTTDDDADDDGGASGNTSSSSGGKKDSGATSSSGGEPEACFGALGPQVFPFPAATAGQNKCTAATLAAAKTACFSQGATQATCDAYKASNEACLTCIGGGEATDPYPVVVPVAIGGQNYSVLNVNGCIAAVAGVSADCAKVVSNITVCRYANCEECEATDPNNSPELTECLTTASESADGCKELIDGAECLSTESADSGVTDAQIEAACGGENDEFDALFDKIGLTLCGPGGGTPPTDAGSDAN